MGKDYEKKVKDLEDDKKVRNQKQNKTMNKKTQTNKDLGEEKKKLY